MRAPTSGLKPTKAQVGQESVDCLSGAAIVAWLQTKLAELAPFGLTPTSSVDDVAKFGEQMLTKGLIKALDKGALRLSTVPSPSSLGCSLTALFASFPLPLLTATQFPPPSGSLGRFTCLFSIFSPLSHPSPRRNPIFQLQGRLVPSGGA